MAIKICRQNKEAVMAKMQNGQLDAFASSNTNFVDEVIVAMYKNGILDCLEQGIPDKRADNTKIPFNLFLTLSATAKMKIKTSLTDIPFAITDHRTLSELGWNARDTADNLEKGLMRESSLRAIINKYSHNDFLLGYNKAVQDFIFRKFDLSPDIHILDCTKLEVNLKNTNYEGSKIAKDDDGKKSRGYKLATLRGVTDDKGIGVIEDIRFGSMDIHDLELSRDMLYNSPVLKRGDILICDRGFISREVINYLKAKRGVDVYIPLKSNMITFGFAVDTANYENKWSNHPNKKRKHQKITLVPNVGEQYQGEEPENNVDLNACVVWNTQPKGTDNEYFVFITTDLTQSAINIIKMYELRPEIEEDFRQLKDFWELEDFKSTKLNFVCFHIVSTLFGYLFYQLFKMLPEGEKYARKCLPVILKNYTSKAQNFTVYYVDDEFAVLSTLEFAKLYSECTNKARNKIDLVMDFKG